MSYHVVDGAEIDRERQGSPISTRFRRGLDSDKVGISEGIHRLKLIVFWSIEFQSRA